MADTFSVNLTKEMSDAASVWGGLEHARALLESEFGSKYESEPWEAGDVGRTFRRRSLNELRGLVAPYAFKSTWIDSYFHAANSFAHVEGRVFVGSTYSVTITFRGPDRLAVERDAHIIHAALEREGSAFKRGEIEVSSQDDGEPESTLVPTPATPPKQTSSGSGVLVERAPAAPQVQQVVNVSYGHEGALKTVETAIPRPAPNRFWAFVGRHVVGVIVGAAGAILAVLAMSWLGISV